MFRTFESNQIIGDNFLANYLHKNNPRDIFFLRNKKDNIYLPIKIDKKIYILFNTGIDCICNEVIPKNVKTMIPDTFAGFITKREVVMKHINQNLKLNNGMFYIIKLKMENNRYYYSNDMKEYDYCIILDINMKESFLHLPELNIRNIPQQNPMIFIPTLWKSEKIEEIDFTNDKLEITYNIFKLIINFALSFKSNIFENKPQLYLAWPYSDDGVLKPKPIEPKFFDDELKGYVECLGERTTYIFCNDKVSKRGTPEFQKLDKSIREGKNKISQCIIKNPIDSLKNIIIFSNIVTESFFPKGKKIISEEDADKNAKILLELEENEKKLAEIKKEKNKEANKKKNEINKLKSLFRKLFKEAEVFIPIMKSNSANIKLAENKKKIILKNLANNALQYYNNKKSSDIVLPQLAKNVEDDNINCEIGTDEYRRRVQNWNFEEFLPEIYCMSKKELISIFSKKEPKEQNLWLFNLNYNYF